MALPLLPGEETMLEFRAGKMVLQDSQVRADPRKGMCRIVKGAEGLVHVQWLDRTSNHLEDDFIVFPDEAIFEKVQQSSGRVYLLKFKEDDRRFFFWLQEPNAEADSQLCTSFNYHINQPLEMDDGTDIVAEEQEPSQPVENSVGVAPPSLGLGEQQPVQLSDLQRILSSLNSASGSGDVSMYARDPGPTLSEVLTVENVLPLLENCHWEERLSPYLPEGNWTKEAIAELMKSTQFRQQLDMFSMALRSGQMDLTQFGIDPSKCDYTVASFLEAIEDQMSAPKDDMDTD